MQGSRSPIGHLYQAHEVVTDRFRAVFFCHARVKPGLTDLDPRVKPGVDKKTVKGQDFVGLVLGVTGEKSISFSSVRPRSSVCWIPSQNVETSRWSRQ